MAFKELLAITQVGDNQWIDSSTYSNIFCRAPQLGSLLKTGQQFIFVIIRKIKRIINVCWIPYYASPTSGEAYRDRQLTTNFEFWVEIFCVPTCFHKRIPKPCLSVCPSVCPYPEKINHHSFVNISPTLVIDTSMERSSRVLHHRNPKIGFFFKKVRNSNFDLCWRAEITIASSISVLNW